jgi:hypothetical protein
MQMILRDLAIEMIRLIDWKGLRIIAPASPILVSIDPDKRVYFRYVNGMGVSLTAERCPLPCFALT